MYQYLYLISKIVDEENVYKEITIRELAGLCGVSNRYMQKLMRQFEADELLDVQRGMGRGNKTRVSLNIGKLEAAKLLIKDLNDKSKMTDIIDFVKEEKLMDDNSFHLWFTSYLLKSGSGSNMSKLTFSLPDVELRINPLNAVSRYDSHFISMIHDTLFKYNEQYDKYDMNMLHHFESDEEGWVFYLKKDLWFHDGSPVTSNDIKSSLEQGLGHRPHLISDYEFEIIDENIFRIVASDSVEYLKAILSHDFFSILPEVHDKNYEIGCGPFKVENLNESNISLSKFSLYHAKKPWIDGLECIFSEEDSLHTITRYPRRNIDQYNKVETKPDGFKYILLNTIKLNDNERKEILENINFKNLVNNDEVVINEANWIRQKSDSLKKIIIGTQAAREKASYCDEGLRLKRDLESIGYECEVKRIFSDEGTEAYKGVDIFIGGVLLMQNYHFQSIVFFNSFERRFAEMLSPVHVEKLSRRPADDNVTLKNYVNEVYDYLHSENILSKIATREYSYYYLNDEQITNVQMQPSGLIDFREIIYRQ
ncbi:ABC transporter substrate-binding protein [Salinicoccus sp. YB14-2]|uniref:ABC transporter substrate-binding protein n=1 Tax=Salinicoccus sp. YB14-2 TaxID=1572701 RepID=UPI00068FF48F|nr:ABC transporter substrate-binding protein [Salinicoccus sp. YB14-2]